MQVLLPFSADFLLFFLTLFYFNFRLIVLNKVFSSYSWTWLVPINDTSLTPVDSRTSWGHWKLVSTNHRPGERPWSRSCPGGRSRSSLTRQRSRHAGQTLQTRLKRWVKNPEKRERETETENGERAIFTVNLDSENWFKFERFVSHSYGWSVHLLYSLIVWIFFVLSWYKYIYIVLDIHKDDLEQSYFSL